jgi:signal transduction histidine kinase
MNAAGGPRRRLWSRVETMSVGQLLATTIGMLLVLAVVGIGLALVANGQLNRNRGFLLDQIGPALRATLELENALVNEETGVRGYAIANEQSFLSPYRSGLADEARAYATLREREEAIGPALAAEVEAIREKAQSWRREFVTPALARSSEPARRAIELDREGKRLFDSVRESLGRLRAALMRKDLEVRKDLNDAAKTLELLLILATVLVLGGIVGSGFLLRKTIIRPLAQLGAQARRVAGGQFELPLARARGPREIVEVGGEIDAMRERIVEELSSVQAAQAQLEEQAIELRRSNADLEQFAYVASHDLQEPLRKVASFCQALKTRYGGQLDARADQYIDFAVDGAKRMQTLINDLLAFSRIGRSGREHEPVLLGEALADAQLALADALEGSGGRVQVDELPLVDGDRAQLASLFQNLISNAIKFRGEEPPLVRIEVVPDGDEWLLSCSDNGIGIEPEYAERIFLIFQRLHSREAYEGSGIGLALCRKIVEYHGGRIWLEESHTGGACFRFALPMAKETTR